MGYSFSLKGDKELLRALRQKTEKEAVKTIVRKNGAELQQAAQRKSPVDTGNLKRSIGLELSDGDLTATVEPTAEYAPYVEWGTRFMDAQPFVKPAFNAQKEKFKADLERLVK